MIPEPLPEGYRFKATGKSGITWIVKAPHITFETPDGPIEIGMMDGQPYIRTYNMQGRVGIGGPDNTVVFLFGQPKSTSDRSQNDVSGYDDPADFS